MKPVIQWMREKPTDLRMFDLHAFISAIQDDARNQGMRDAIEIIDKLKAEIVNLNRENQLMAEALVATSPH